MGNAFAAGRSGGILWLFYDQIQHVALGYMTDGRGVGAGNGRTKSAISCCRIRHIA